MSLSAGIPLSIQPTTTSPFRSTISALSIWQAATTILPRPALIRTPARTARIWVLTSTPSIPRHPARLPEPAETLRRQGPGLLTMDHRLLSLVLLKPKTLTMAGRGWGATIFHTAIIAREFWLHV